MGWWWWCCPIYSIQSAPTATNTAIILLYTLIAFNKMAAAEEQTQYPGITRPMPPKPQAQKQFQEHSNQVREQGRFNQLRAPKYGQRSEEEKLLDYLFETYNPSARPVLDSSKTVNVNITLSLLHIQDLVSTGYYYFLFFFIDIQSCLLFSNTHIFLSKMETSISSTCRAKISSRHKNIFQNILEETKPCCIFA